MSFGHEKLDVYRLSLEYVAWVFAISDTLTGKHRHARDQWLRSCQSIPLNIAEGNGKTLTNDRRRYFEISRGSAMECAATQDILEISKAIDKNKNREGKVMLDRIVAMLTRLGGRGYCVNEEIEEYGKNIVDIDTDTDSDSDNILEKKI